LPLPLCGTGVAAEIIGGPYNWPVMLAAEQVLVGRPSPLVLGTLIVILGASVGVFVALVKRETKRRRAVALAQWARSRGLRIAADPDDLPALAPLKQFNAKVRCAIGGQDVTLARLQTADAGLTAASASPRTWSVLVRKLPCRWPTTALRPTAHAVSLVDLFSLSSYPSLMPTERFMIFGSESRAAKALAESEIPALLPADVALVLHEEHLILDFSTRPFDEVEFDRLIDLSRQLAPRLPEN
jgi:hypothetical protein